ncbi:MAG: hypothetical protein AAFY29_01560 [Pseudomonadota bacterium]
MSDFDRSQITNAIWLCRNCHKLIDTDATRFSSDVLFAWREMHEEFVVTSLGKATDLIEHDLERASLAQFDEFPPIVRRIVRDKPTAWEWMLAKELLQYLNAPVFRRLHDVRSGSYFRAGNHVASEEVLTWAKERLTESRRSVAPVNQLMTRLTDSFGEPGEPGDAEEIRHVCTLIQACISEFVAYEERLQFDMLPDEASRLVELLKEGLGSQVQKLELLPEFFDEALCIVAERDGDEAAEPRVIEKVITFELSDRWIRDVRNELQKIRDASDSGRVAAEPTSYSWMWLTILLVVIVWVTI